MKRSRAVWKRSRLEQAELGGLMHRRRKQVGSELQVTPVEFEALRGDFETATDLPGIGAFALLPLAELRVVILAAAHRTQHRKYVAKAVGTYPREVRRIGWRYLERGVQDALTDDPRPKPDKLLDTRQQAAIVAMVCGPPPPGYARWTIRVTTEETQRRGIVADVGRETIRQVLAHHELKPWRKNNVVRPHAGR